MELYYPADNGHFIALPLNRVLKMSILKYGPCRPSINFPYSIINDIDGKFPIDYYNMKTKTGVLIPHLLALLFSSLG